MTKVPWFDKILAPSSPPRNGREIELAIALGSLRDDSQGGLKRFAEKSGMSARKVYYLAEVGEKLKQVRIQKARLERIGWTKLQIIAKKITRENANELFTLAESHTCHQLKAHMQGGESETKTHCVLMYFSPEQYEEFEKAILSHGGERSGRGLIKKEEAILNIIASLPKARRIASSS